MSKKINTDDYVNKVLEHLNKDEAEIVREEIQDKAVDFIHEFNADIAVLRGGIPPLETSTERAQKNLKKAKDAVEASFLQITERADHNEFLSYLTARENEVATIEAGIQNIKSKISATRAQIKTLEEIRDRFITKK